jgi:hypothetical protein
LGEFFNSLLGLDVAAADLVLKYSSSQPRVPAGNGRVSGQWTRIGRLIFQSLSQAAAEQFAQLSLRFPAAAVFLGVLFIPANKTSPNDEHKVPGHPGLRYGRLPGERAWRIIYQGDDGDEHMILQQADGLLRDPKGQVVGRILPNDHVAIDLAAIAPHHADDDQPRLCPAPSPDNYGQGRYSIARAYEDQVKLVVNPREPTPSGLAMALANPMKGGAIVKFDDCQHEIGMMVEAEGPTFTGPLQRAKASTFDQSVDEKLLRQADSQVQATGTRRVRWYLSDVSAADHVRSLFTKSDKGPSRIEFKLLPYAGKTR